MAELKLFKGGGLAKWWAAQSHLSKAAIAVGVPAAGALALLHRKQAAAQPTSSGTTDPSTIGTDPYAGYYAAAPADGGFLPAVVPLAPTSSPAQLSAHQLHVLHMEHVATLGGGGTPSPAPTPTYSPHQLHLLHQQHLAHIASGG